MFTGLIADVGEVAQVDASGDGSRLTVATHLGAELSPGDSIAVNGVCLTATEATPEAFSADVMNQTLSVTSLEGVEAGTRLNLEPAMRASDRLGGHIVQGHVDGTAEVTEVIEDGFSRRLRFVLPADLRRYVIEHGSIALDGASLTIAHLEADTAEVSLIPETLERTTLGEVEAGRRLNVEVDLMARYAERLLQGFDERKGSQDG